ncbi:MAG: hypothetical protein HC906_19025, partial [Bacteroidales bacterium]|nr:hypothetical protein [Bacteroidales bacterium]
MLKDFNLKFTFTRKAFDPVSPDFVFWYYSNGYGSALKSHFTLSDISLNIRYQPKVTWIIDGLRRFPVNFNKAPVFSFDYFYGQKGWFNSDFDVRKISVAIEHNFIPGAFGMMVYDIRFSHSFKSLPYPALNVLAGNQSFFRSDRTYNLMNYGEFVASETFELFYA